jgi:hypothetical protein
VTERRASALCTTAIVLAVLGVFGTWRTSGPVSLDGVEGPHNGWLTIIFGLIALTGVRSLSRGGWLGIEVVLGCAVVMLVAPLHVLSRAGRSGWGVWLTVAASIALVMLAIAAAAARVRGSTPAGPTASR